MRHACHAIAAFAAAILLASCQTDDRAARLQPFVGRTVADFSRATGLVPRDSYNTAAGRVFVVDGPPIAVAIAPGAVVTGGCKMQLETVATSQRGTADDWRIAAIDAHGPC